MQLPHEELKSLLVLNRLSLVGGKTVCGLLSEGTKPSEILARIRDENFLGKAELLEKTVSSFHPESEMEHCQKLQISLIGFCDENYPKPLKEISDPPLVLYAKGTILASDDSAIAIVGTRHPSLYGTNQTRKFSSGLAAQGMTIVSGLAQGIDQAAHEAALKIPYGRTLAVLGCGLDVNYPSNAGKLREEIAQRGALISEYALGTPPLAENFPRRNRIISGLSTGVLVVEAHARSGSLITARMALEQGREVFAVPGPVDQLTSRGTHHLIKEGAGLVEEPADIIEALAAGLIHRINETPVPPAAEEPAKAHRPQSPNEPGFSTEEGSLWKLLREKPLASEEIAREGQWTPEQLAFLLTMLEMKGKVRKNPDGRFAAARF